MWATVFRCFGNDGKDRSCIKKTEVWWDTAWGAMAYIMWRKLSKANPTKTDVIV